MLSPSYKQAAFFKKKLYYTSIRMYKLTLIDSLTVIIMKRDQKTAN